MATRAKLMTAKELLAMPDDGFRYELVRGELVRRQYAGMRYAHASSKILFSLLMNNMSDKLGMSYPPETGFLIETDPDHVRAPSAAFVGPDRMTLVEDDDPLCDRYFPGPPDLAVEVAIPSDTYFYIEDKIADWFDAGACMVVVVNADIRTVRVFTRLPTLTLSKRETHWTAEMSSLAGGYL